MDTTAYPCLPHPNLTASSPNRLNVRMKIHRTFLTLNRIFAIHHHQHTRIFCIKSMAETTSKNNAATTELTETKNKDQSPHPPPPEKPLPGDCCGSGCVRCVWDVYYDELEDYNKMCKSNDDDKSNSIGNNDKDS